jgi:hypothetical protein
MSARARTLIGSVLAFAIPWSVSPSAVFERQHTVKPESPLALPMQQPETAPSKQKKHTSVFDPLEMQGFSVALLLGETQGSSTPDNVPAGATKALADVREFLPYKSYRLLDTQWIRCCAGSYVSGRLRGLDEQQYSFQIDIDSVSGSRLSAKFSLTDAVPAVKGFTKDVINSNFSMETGETVVIGTSSLKGDKALVVLLTAVPRSTISSKVKKGSVK